MKKIKSLLLMAVCALALSACTSIDSKLDQLEKACQQKDQVKVAKICAELESKAKDFTPEQEKRLAEIMLDYSFD